MAKFDIICFGACTKDIFYIIPQKALGKKICFFPGAKLEIKKLLYFSGGGASNTSVGFARLGLKTGIASAIGDDLAGRQIIAELKKEKVSALGMVKARKSATQLSVVLTGFGAERVIFTHAENLSLLSEKKIPWKKLSSKWFYISSLHSNFPLLKKIIQFAHKSKTKIAFNPGSAELGLGLQTLSTILKKTDALVLNAKEAALLTNKKEIKKNLRILCKYSKIVAITNGKNGAYAAAEGKFFFQKAFKAKVVDTTGAGDAFSSGFIYSLIKGKSVGFALYAGSANAASVVQFFGAKNKLLDQKELGRAVENFRQKNA
ncbi:MAG: carbohydrate kinase family protein [Candidatus Diapherotrites archaeon]|nr:carbohydrate kinase family protein [Candidatus Diapherotrites archaeon]